MSDNTETKLALAAELRGQNRLAEAEDVYIDILRGDANHYQALLSLGLLYGDQARFEQALILLEKAALMNPQSVEAYYHIGFMLFNLKRYDEIETPLRKVLALQPMHFQSLHILGLIAYSNKQFEKAYQYLETALSMSPKNISVLNNFGLVLREFKRFDEALTIYNKALILSPDDDNLLYNKFIVLYELKRYDDALENIERVLIKDPDNVKILNCKADLLMHLKRTDEMMAYFKKIVALDNSNLRVRSELLYNLMQTCQWQDVPAHIQVVRSAISQPIVVEHDKIMPLIGHALPGFTAQDHFDLSRRHAVNVSAEMGDLKQKLSFSFSKKQKQALKIGYLSLDYRYHPLAQLIPEVFELHDRKQFSIYAYSYGPNDNSNKRARIKNGVDYFIDVEDFDCEAIAKKIHADEIDILVDLTGFSWASRTQLLALRPAPIQVSYLGYLGTMGADFIDALIADEFVIPPESKKYYSEKIYYLPCYQANDRRCAVGAKPSRTVCGLPEDALVFCCFNQVFKITPEVFDVWCKLLQNVPNSVLWLLASNGWAVENLREQLQQCGLDPNRLVFANIIPLDEHLARLQCADLMLDTHPYNAGTTTSNALWVGLPTVTYCGSTFPSRMAGSLLTALGVPELITYNLKDYYELAFTLATDHQKRKAISDKMKANRDTSLLFDTPLLVQKLEAIYFKMWDDYIHNEFD